MSLLNFYHKEYFRYFLVGSMTAFFYFGLIALGTKVLEFEYRIVVSVSYLIAVIFHFIASRKITFLVSDDKVPKQLVRYVIVLLLNYIITIIVVSYLVDYLQFSHYVGAIIAIGITIVVGYGTSKFWVFNKKEKE